MVQPSCLISSFCVSDSENSETSSASKYAGGLQKFLFFIQQVIYRKLEKGEHIFFWPTDTCVFTVLNPLLWMTQGGKAVDTV